MPELTREEKLKLIEKLPQRLQDFLYSEDTGAFLLYLGNKYKLPDEKISALSKIIFDIIVKITPIEKLEQEIANKVISDVQIASAMAKELNSDLITPALMPTKEMPPTPVTPSITAPPTMPMPPKPAYQPEMPKMPVVAPRPITPPPAVPPTFAPVPPSFPSSNPPAGGQVSSSMPADRYREPIAKPAPASKIATPAPVGRNVGEVVDLRKMPLPAMPVPMAAAPIPPSPIRNLDQELQARKPTISPMAEKSKTPVEQPNFPQTATKIPTTPLNQEITKPISPLTFTRPIEKAPLIEANPHNVPPQSNIGEKTEMPKMTLKQELDQIQKPAQEFGIKAEPGQEEKANMNREEEPQFIIRPPGLAPTDIHRNILDLRKDKGEL